MYVNIWYLHKLIFVINKLSVAEMVEIWFVFSYFGKVPDLPDRRIRRESGIYAVNIGICGKYIVTARADVTRNMG